VSVARVVGAQERKTMNTIKRFLQSGSKHFRQGSSRFDRYYLGVLQTGSGSPTADEARKDLKEADRMINIYGWPR
jgi:hypothetical protein